MSVVSQRVCMPDGPQNGRVKHHPKYSYYQKRPGSYRSQNQNTNKCPSHRIYIGTDLPSSLFIRFHKTKEKEVYLQRPTTYSARGKLISNNSSMDICTNNNLVNNMTVVLEFWRLKNSRNSLLSARWVAQCRWTWVTLYLPGGGRHILP